jgi:hypothetical protein
MVDFAATVFELKTVPSDVRKPTDDALSPKEAAEKQGSVDGKGNLSVKRDSLELNKTTTSSDPHRSSRHRRSRSHKEKAITTQRNSQYEGLLKQVRYRASEIAAEMASKYNYDTPLDSPPTEIILELRELAASLIRAGTETEDMASISSELNKLNSQIRRMEDCVVEHRLPDSNARSDGLSYLSRPLELIYLPTSLLDSPIRDEEDQLSAGLEVIFGVWFPDEKWSCSWQEQKLGTITEVAFHYNTSFSWDHVDEGLVVEFPHNALSEDLNSFILLSAAWMQQLDGFLNDFLRYTDKWHKILHGTDKISGARPPMEWINEYLKMLEVLRPAVHEDGEVAKLVQPLIVRLNKRLHRLWRMYVEAERHDTAWLDYDSWKKHYSPQAMREKRLLRNLPPFFWDLSTQPC